VNFYDVRVEAKQGLTWLFTNKAHSLVVCICMGEMPST
jgi:hypothetical protein